MVTTFEQLLVVQSSLIALSSFTTACTLNSPMEDGIVTSLVSTTFSPGFKLSLRYNVATAEEELLI